MYQNFIIPYLHENSTCFGCHTAHRQVHCAWQCPPNTRPTTFHVWKTRGCQCSFRLLMMGGVSPKTCWASHKYGIIKFWYIVASFWNFLYEFWYFVREIMGNRLHMNHSVPHCFCHCWFQILLYLRCMCYFTLCLSALLQEKGWRVLAVVEYCISLCSKDSPSCNTIMK